MKPTPFSAQLVALPLAATVPRGSRNHEEAHPPNGLARLGLGVGSGDDPGGRQFKTVLWGGGIHSTASETLVWYLSLGICRACGEHHI